MSTIDTFRQSPEEFNKFVEGAEKAALSPNGWYVTVPEWLARVSDDGHSVRLFGEVTLQDVDAKFLEANPDSGATIGGKGRLKFDLNFSEPTNFAAKLTAAAYRAYTKAYGHKPESPDSLIEYLVMYPVRLRAIQGKANEEKGYPASMMVVDIRAT